MRSRKSRFIPLLNLAAIIFSLISIYYTAEGFMIILGADTFIKEIFAWGFAIGISCVLLFCSLSVAQFISERKGVLLSIVFLVFALISLFFNINSIYGDFTSKDYIKADVYERGRSLTTLKTRAKHLTDSLYNVNKFKKTLDSLILAAEREANDKYRPGKRGKWREIDLQIPGAKSNYNDALAMAQRVLTPLDSIEVQFHRQKSIALNSATEANVVSLNELYNEYVVTVNTIEVGKKHSTTKFTNNSGDPAYTMKLLAKALTFQEDVTKEEYSYIVLSSIVGTIIDFPIFFALVLLRWPTNKRKKKDKERSLFSRIDGRRESKRKRKGGNIKWD